jgi:hypothetical protein
MKPLQESASWDEISHLWFETMILFQIILVNNLIPTWRLIGERVVFPPFPILPVIFKPLKQTPPFFAEA